MVSFMVRFGDRVMVEGMVSVGFSVMVRVGSGLCLGLGLD